MRKRIIQPPEKTRRAKKALGKKESAEKLIFKDLILLRTSALFQGKLQ